MTIAMLLVNTIEAAERSSRETNMNDNPLLEPAGLPAFDRIRPEHVSPAVQALLADADAALEKAVGPDVPADYEAMSAVLDVATERLGRAWGAVSHLNHVADTPALRAAYTENLARITEFYTRLGADERLYAKYKAIAASPAASRLSAPRQRALSNAMRDFVLSGAELQGEAKARFRAIQERMAEAGAEVFRARARRHGQLRALRRRGRARRRAGRREGGFSRAGAGRRARRPQAHAALPELLPGDAVRHEPRAAPARSTPRTSRARASWAPAPSSTTRRSCRNCSSCARKKRACSAMPATPTCRWWPRWRSRPPRCFPSCATSAGARGPMRSATWHELRTFAADELGLPDLQAWDQAYASEKLRQSRYAFSDQEVKQYFTEPKVLDGLFRIIETLFEVSIRPDTAPVWNDGVRFYRIDRGTQLVGRFYLDPYARNGKRSGAWMDDACGRWARPDGTLQTPVAHLVCNFAPPVGTRPALLTHDDVITLFHEFGHGLHHMLTQVDDLGVAGISGVEWDAVELPSQFMENFCWEWEVVRRLSAHVDTGAPLPRELFDKMIAAKNFQSGLQHAAAGRVRHLRHAPARRAGQRRPGAAGARRSARGGGRERAAAVQPLPAHVHAHVRRRLLGRLLQLQVGRGAVCRRLERLPGTRRARSPKPAGACGARCWRPAAAARAMDSFKAFRGREPQIDALLRQEGMV